MRPCVEFFYYVHAYIRMWLFPGLTYVTYVVSQNNSPNFGFPYAIPTCWSSDIISCCRDFVVIFLAVHVPCLAEHEKEKKAHKIWHFEKFHWKTLPFHVAVLVKWQMVRPKMPFSLKRRKVRAETDLKILNFHCYENQIMLLTDIMSFSQISMFYVHSKSSSCLWAIRETQKCYNFISLCIVYHISTYYVRNFFSQK